MKSKTVFGIAAALVHLQNQGIVHRYLTPSCILFDSNYEPRLTDFSLSIFESYKTNQPQKILHEFNIYQAPELISNGYNNYLCDNFSYGVILYQIVTGKEAFDSNKKEYKILQDMECNRRPPLPIKTSPKLSHMIEDLWDSNPNNRPELIDIIKALINYDMPLFEETDIEEYKKYRERVLKSTFFTKEQLEYLKQPYETDLDENNFENYLTSAIKRNVNDMVKVARCYEKGIGIDPNLKESINWYSKAADQNDPEALYKLANLYRDGYKSFGPNLEHYVLYLKRASDLKYPQAVIDYAILFLTGESGVKQNISKGEQMLKMMSDKPYNNGKAQYLLAKFYKNKGDIKQAVKLYNMARESDVDDAICEYALMLIEGKDVLANLPEGMKILKQAADKGLPMANYNLGLIYEKGLYYCEKDHEKAFNYYKVAADKGIIPAMVAVGKALFTKQEWWPDKLKCKYDPIQAARLFEYSAASGDPEGLYWWGKFLINYTDSDYIYDTAELNKEYGGTPKDISLALMCFKKSAEAGFVPSMIVLGIIYHNGAASEINLELSKHFLHKSIDHGSKEAQKVFKLFYEESDDDDESF